MAWWSPQAFQRKRLEGRMRRRHPQGLRFVISLIAGGNFGRRDTFETLDGV